MSGRKISGVIGYFRTPQDILKGMKKIKKEHFFSVDAFTPYPIHGMDEAQGLKRSTLPYVVFCFALLGCMIGIGFQYWSSAIAWPLNVGGKPLSSWPAFVPVIFELTVLFGALSAFLGVIFYCRLPNMKRESFDPAITCDKFVIFIENISNKSGLKNKEKKHRPFDEKEAKKALQEVGAYEVRKVFEGRWF